MKDRTKLIIKARNNNPLVVIFKKPNCSPEVKIISNIYYLKKIIVEKDLKILPYHNVYIVCFNKKTQYKTKPNITYKLESIWGDLILVDIDKEKREFKSLSQEDIFWYLQDLENKSIKRTEENKILSNLIKEIIGENKNGLYGSNRKIRRFRRK